MQSLDTRTACRLLMSKLLPLIASTLAGAVLVGLLAGFVMKKQYTAQALMYVSNLADATDGQAGSYSNLNSSGRLVLTYVEVLENRSTLELVLPHLSRTLTAGQLGGMISMEGIENTALLVVSATADDPAFAAELCNALTDVAPQTLQKVVGAGSVRVVSRARKGAQTWPNLLIMALVGAVAGFLAASAVIFLRHLTDTAIRTEDDLKERINVPILGTVLRYVYETAGGKKHV